ISVRRSQNCANPSCSAFVNSHSFSTISRPERVCVATKRVTIDHIYGTLQITFYGRIHHDNKSRLLRLICTSSPSTVTPFVAEDPKRTTQHGRDYIHRTVDNGNTLPESARHNFG